MRKIIYLGFNGFLKHKRGVENVIEFQSSLFDNTGFYIHWGENFEIYKYNRFICISLNSRSLYKFATLSIVVAKLYARHGKSLFIHSHNPLMSIFLYRKTDLLTVHDALYYQQKHREGGMCKGVLFYLLEKYLYTRCRFIHFISMYTKKQSLFPQSSTNFSIIYNSSHFESKINDFSNSILNTKYNFLSEKTYCLIVRSLEERARIDLVIQTAKQRKDMLFVIAGKGPLQNLLQKIILENNVNNVHLLGFVSDADLISLYSSASIVMVPAEYGEGFGLPIIEGYLFNKPVIASKKCAIPEIIIHESYLFNNDIPSILKCLAFTEHTNKENYKEYYMKCFSRSVIKDCYLNLYNECMRLL